MTIEDLGVAKKVVVAKDTTTIIGGNGSPDAIKARIEEIRKHVEMLPANMIKTFQRTLSKADQRDCDCESRGDD